jgi:hypothetical protein
MEGYTKIVTYSSEIEGELAKAALASAGIEAYLKFEDTGGMFPTLQQAEGVAIYVKPEDVEEAKKVLSAQPAE